MNEQRLTQMKSYLRTIPDFPKPGIQFKDITPLLADPTGFQITTELFCECIQGLNIDKVVAIESRGFILGSALAQKLKLGLVLVRKRGKLPSKTIRETYNLEYGTDELEIHTDALSSKDRVLVIDDVIATGGTALCAAKLCRRLGAQVVGVAALMELVALKARDHFGDIPLLTIFKD